MDTDLKKIIIAIFKQRKFILKSTSVFFIVLLLYFSFFYSKTYTSTSKVYLSDKTANKLSLGSLSSFGIQSPFSNTGSAIDKMSAITELIGANSFLSDILNESINIDSLNTTTVSSFLMDGKPMKGNKYEIEAALANKLVNSIKVSENFESSLVSIKVSSKNKFASQSINTVIINKANRKLIALENSQGIEKLKFINSRINSVNKDLEKVENDLLDFRYNNKNVSSSPSLQMDLEKLLREVTFQTGLINTLLQQRELTKIQAIDQASPFKIFEEPTLPFYPSSTRRLVQLLSYTFLSIFIPIFGIVFTIFYRNLLNAIKNFIRENN
ncbi:Wzz/FepE/Etk N-terminal domain-containing protein [Candidatus Marinimicrobia bacterium]|nr:Wzz/FepE/Etk N-terminal domain-containing protein [Candidatus Neomarinimicrobiota bacterium]|tara:strand:- start:11610 stop:12587 length:978 start_codon:yes stop_codon:yes gene_type:complete